ncbi:SOS response-associated peptidase [Microbacterium sp. gxy059]|uniref:SOS response-associated peptidase n=1 Tax=Microbacterium sp. gxy059 TaxID=2957199 RepID=UPI003D95ED33
MCGRFVVADPGVRFVSEIDPDIIADDLPEPSFNVAPTQQAAIVACSTRTDPPTRRVVSARWGLVPGWAKDLSAGARAINARSETAATKRTFSSALHARRAVVPVSGFYEWQERDGEKTPQYIHPQDGGPLLLAGLYEWWRDPARAQDDPARWVLSFTILTRAAEGPLAALHPRMPVFVDVDHARAWLDPSADDPSSALDACVADAPREARRLAWHAVDARVGSVRHDDPALIVPVAS